MGFPAFPLPLSVLWELRVKGRGFLKERKEVGAALDEAVPKVGLRPGLGMLRGRG